jgi:protein-L-isoaspartate O-methyltransferase
MAQIIHAVAVDRTGMPTSDARRGWGDESPRAPVWLTLAATRVYTVDGSCDEPSASLVVRCGIMPARRVRRAVIALVALLAFASVTPGAAQSRHPVSGRVLAPTMGVEGADWLDRPEREREEAPSKAIAALGLKAGDVVADIGAGSGYYTVRLAEAVGPTGRVVATDLQPGMLAIIKGRLARERVANVELVQGRGDDPVLPARTFDLLLMVDVYHELAAPQVFVRKLKEALKRDGRLVLIEFRREDPRVPIREEHKMSVSQVREELGAYGFRIERVIDVLPWQHIIVLRPEGSARP